MNAMTVPESIEVIEQFSKEIVGLHRLYTVTQAEAHHKTLTSLVATLLLNRTRTHRVANLWAEAVVGPIRGKFDLDDPDAAIFVGSTRDENPLEEGESLVGAFLTAYLHSDAEMALAVLDRLTRAEPEQTRLFMGLLLAMVSNTG